MREDGYLNTNAVPEAVMVLMKVFDLSLRDVERAAAKNISKTGLHRILTGNKEASPIERQHITQALLTCLTQRCDSSFLWR
jgi:hypothetical protein